MKKFLVLLIVINHQLTVAQIATIAPSSTSIAGTSVADTHSWTAFHNPAMLGYLEHSEVELLFENRYIINELSTKMVQVALPTKVVNTGLSFSHFGYSLYHEMLGGITFARNFSNKFSMGMQFNYYTAYFSATNSYRSAFFPELGLSVRLARNFSIGFHSFNPFQSNIKTEFVTKRIPSLFSLGSEYYFSPEFTWRSQIEKEISSNYRFATGFEYQMLEKIAVKIGAYNSDYLIPCLGSKIQFGSFLANLNCELHPLIGINTLIAIKYMSKR